MAKANSTQLCAKLYLIAEGEGLHSIPYTIWTTNGAACIGLIRLPSGRTVSYFPRYSHRGILGYVS